MAATSNNEAAYLFCVALLICLGATTGAPSHVPEIDESRGTTLLARLRRSAAGEDGGSLNVLSNMRDMSKRNEDLADEASQLEELLNKISEFQHRPNGGSFSPPRRDGNDGQDSSLPIFKRLPALENDCSTCVSDSFRWSGKH